jgi:hypothetical protein
MKMLTPITITKAIDTVFKPWFARDTWQAWIAFLSALFALPMSEGQQEIFRKHTGRSIPQPGPAREGWLVVGRRGGKSLISALVAVFLACFKDYSGFLAPGEIATIMVLASDKRQARTIMRYVNGFLDNVPMLQALVSNRTQESIELNNRVCIEIHTASFRSTRGYTMAAVICDEIAFWRSDESANPDSEIIAALRPGLATIPGAMLLCISSPYARRGALWDAHRKHYGKDGDPVLVWQASTLEMNPSIDPAIIQEAYENDPSAAAAEYGAEFRSDIESYVQLEAVQACVVPGRRELAPIGHFEYRAFVDPSGGSADSFTLAIAHDETDIRFKGEDFARQFSKDWEKVLEIKKDIRSQYQGKLVLDCIREMRPPFSPEGVVREYAELLRSYGVSMVTGDRYAGEWPREQFRKHGIEYLVSEKSKSEIYQEMLPLIMSGRAEILEDKRLISQLCSLERRTSRGGRDSIDHAPGSHDDLINAAAGALVTACASQPAFTAARIKWIR